MCVSDTVASYWHSTVFVSRLIAFLPQTYKDDYFNFPILPTGAKHLFPSVSHMSEMLLITGHAKHLAVSVSLWVNNNNNDRDCDSAFIVALSGNLTFFPNSLRPVLCPFF